jgi:hypothetical protein
MHILDELAMQPALEQGGADRGGGDGLQTVAGFLLKRHDGIFPD